MPPFGQTKMWILGQVKFKHYSMLTQAMRYWELHIQLISDCGSGKNWKRGRSFADNLGDGNSHDISLGHY